MADNTRKNQNTDNNEETQAPRKRRVRSEADMIARATSMPWFGIGVGPEDAEKYLNPEE